MQLITRTRTITIVYTCTDTLLDLQSLVCLLNMEALDGLSPTLVLHVLLWQLLSL